MNTSFCIQNPSTSRFFDSFNSTVIHTRKQQKQQCGCRFSPLWIDPIWQPSTTFIHEKGASMPACCAHCLDRTCPTHAKVMPRGHTACQSCIDVVTSSECPMCPPLVVSATDVEGKKVTTNKDSLIIALHRQQQEQNVLAMLSSSYPALLQLSEPGWPCAKILNVKGT